MKSHRSYNGPTRGQLLAAAVLSCSMFCSGGMVHGGRPVALNQVADMGFDRYVPARVPKLDKLKLKNGDSLEGYLAAISTQSNVVTWAHPAAASPLLLKREAVQSIRVKQPWGPKVDPCEGSVFFYSGDMLKANIESLSDSTLSVRIPGVGALEVKRDYIRGLAANSGSGEILFDMATADPREWRSQQRRGWQVEEDTISTSMSSCHSGYEINADAEQLSFHFVIESSNPYFNFTFLSDNPYQQYGNSLVVYFSGRSAYFYQNSNRQGRRTLGQINEFSKWEGGKTEVDLYVDRKEGKFHIFANGELKHTWSTAFNNDAPKGNLGFYSQNNNPMTIRGLGVRRWDGTLPGKDEDEKEITKDQIFLMNGDELAGKLKTLEGTSAEVETQSGDIALPINRIDRVNFAKQKDSPTNSKPARVHFFNGSRLAVDIHDVTNNQVAIEHPAFGKVTIPQNFIKHIEFDRNLK